MKKKVFPSRIIPILKDNIPCGKRHAIHQKELAHRLGLRPSRIASMVQYAKKHGLFICSGNNGYWLPKDIDEKKLSAGAIKLYFHLLVLQDRYKLNGESFYHTLQQLVDELGHAKGSIEKWQKELIAANLISIELKHFRNGDKISENRRTYYTIL